MAVKGKLKKTTGEFIAESIQKFGNKYDYRLTEYLGATKKVVIICTEHGKFKQLPGHHLNSEGCPKCSLKAKSARRLKTTKQFIIEAKEVHGNLYEYSNTEYKGHNNHVNIICKEHGVFKQDAGIHLSGSGCQRCAAIKSSKEQVKSNEQFIQEVKAIHGDMLTFEKTDYVNAKTNVTVSCINHGEFSIYANSLLQGCGCPNCAEYGFKSYLPAILYYVKIVRGIHTAYKIGITNNTLKRRFAKDYQYLQEIKTWDFVKGSDARAKEKEILSNFKVYKWQGPQLLLSGNTEMFDRDVLELDTAEKRNG